MSIVWGQAEALPLLLWKTGTNAPTRERHHGDLLKLTFSTFNAVQGFSDANGGVMSINGLGSLVVRRSEFRNCATSKKGGAIYIVGSASAVFDDCWFELNAAELGGAIYLENTAFEIHGCTFLQNRVGSQTSAIGGGVYLSATNTRFDLLLVYNCTFNLNFALDDGGGLFFSGQGLVLRNSTFLLNSAQNGAGAHVIGRFGSGRNVVNITGCNFESNIGNGRGGALALAAPSGLVEDCQFNGNRAGIGGAILLSEGKLSLVIRRNDVYENFAGNFGAGFALIALSTTASPTIELNNFWNNTAATVDFMNSLSPGPRPASI